MTHHVIADMNTPGHIVLRCMHCQAFEAIPLPVSVTNLGDTAEAFITKHAKCRAQEAQPS